MTQGSYYTDGGVAGIQLDPRLDIRGLRTLGALGYQSVVGELPHGRDQALAQAHPDCLVVLGLPRGLQSLDRLFPAPPRARQERRGGVGLSGPTGPTTERPVLER